MAPPAHRGASGPDLLAPPPVRWTDSAITESSGLLEEAPNQRQYPKRPHLVPQREHPELALQRGVPKCAPAMCPHPHTFVGRGERDIEVHYEVIERTVTPEAHAYFRRIVQVTQSEIEKLLMYRIQQMFDPATSSTTNEMALRELGSSMAAGMQAPGLGATSQLAKLEAQKLREQRPLCPAAQIADRHTVKPSLLPTELDSRKMTSFQRPAQNNQTRASAESEHLSKCLVGTLGRILADFGRFADTILKWQSVPTATKDSNSMSNEDAGGFPLTEVIGKPGIEINQGPNNNIKEILERLERQDKENSLLEVKYNSASDELRENRRAFMRERHLWQEKESRLKRLLKKSTDPNMRELLEHDVEFFDGKERRVINEEEVEELMQQQEEKMKEMKDEYEDEIADLKLALENLKAKLLAMEERKNPARELTEKVNELEHLRAELEDTVQHLQSEVQSLRAKLAESDAANEDLLKKFEKAQETVEQAQASLKFTQETLEYEKNKPPPKPEMENKESQVSAKERGKFWKTEKLRAMTVDVVPTVDEASDLRVQVGNKTIQLQEVQKELEELRAAYEAMLKEMHDKEVQWEQELKEAATQTQKLSDLLNKKKSHACSQTERDGHVIHLEEENLKLRELLTAAQSRIAELEYSVEASKRRIHDLEEETAHRPTQVVQIGRSTSGSIVHHGGGFHAGGKSREKWLSAVDALTRRKSTALTMPATGEGKGTSSSGEFVIPKDFALPSPAHTSPSHSSAASPRADKAPEKEEKKSHWSSLRKRGTTLDFKPKTAHTPETTTPGPPPPLHHRPGLRGSVIGDPRRNLSATVGTTVTGEEAGEAAARAELATGMVGQTASSSGSDAAQVQWKAIQPTTVPVSGYATSTAQRPRSAGGNSNAEQLRSSYGGGFSVLENTGWKGTEHQDPAGESRPDLQAAADTTKDSSGDEAARQQVEIAHVAHGLSTVAIQAEAGEGYAIVDQQLALRGAVGRSNSVPDLFGDNARPSHGDPSRERDRLRLSRPKSASSLPIQPRLTVLHGPPDRRNRPQSAAFARTPATLSRPQSAATHSSRPQSAATHPSRPQSAATHPSRPQSAATHASRPQSAARSGPASAQHRPSSAGVYGSALFDSVLHMPR